MVASIFSPLVSPALLPVWETIEFVSIIIVGIGCWGEVWAEHHKFSEDLNNILPSDRTNKKWIRFFWLMVVWGLALELVAFGFAFISSNREIEGLHKDNLGLKSNVADLEKSVFALAHQYDMSTNALAEANMRILSVSNAAAMNSPMNFPIESVEGDCAIGINKNDLPPFANCSRKTALLTLWENGQNNFFGINIPCQIDRASTNSSGGVVLHILVSASKHKTPGSWSKNVTFNNLHFAQLDLSGVSESRFGIDGGFLRLEVNSRFNCEFNFPPQTNNIGGLSPGISGPVWGIVGERREREFP